MRSQWEASTTMHGHPDMMSRCRVEVRESQAAAERGSRQDLLSEQSERARVSLHISLCPVLYESWECEQF